jgi:hypothetical protein
MYPNYEKYLYFFIINTKNQGIGVRNRCEHLQKFDGLWHQFQDFQKHKTNNKEYNEPPIIMSFYKLKPNIVLEYQENGSFKIIYPSISKEFKLEDEDNIKIPFNRIEPIVELLPEIEHSLPFVEPIKIDGKYVYDDWLEMTEGRGGSWL